jgi:hypothetical protein
LSGADEGFVLSGSESGKKGRRESNQSKRKGEAFHGVILRLRVIGHERVDYTQSRLVLSLQYPGMLI